MGILVPKPMLGRQLQKGHRAARGLAGHWLFNEGSGNKVFDLSGNGYDGTLLNGAAWTSGKFGSAIDFFGTDDNVAMALNLYAIGIRRHATFLCWFKVPSSGSVSKDFISDYESSKGMTLKVDSDDAQFYIYPNNHRITVINVVSFDNWHQMVGVMDGANMYLYLDGLQIGTNTLGEDIGDSTSPLRFGTRGDLTDDMTGQLDHVIIWKRALNASEIAELYLRPFAMFDRIPIELWVGATSVGVPPVGMAGAMTTNTGYWGW